MEVTGEFETLDAAVRRHLVEALELAHGNQRQAAVLLAVSRWKLARMVKRYGLDDLVATLRVEGAHRTPSPELEAPSDSVAHDG